MFFHTGPSLNTCETDIIIIILLFYRRKTEAQRVKITCSCMMKVGKKPRSLWLANYVLSIRLHCLPASLWGSRGRCDVYDWNSFLKKQKLYGKLCNFLYAYSTPSLHHNNHHCYHHHQYITIVAQSEKFKAKVSNAQGVVLACTALI